MPNVISPNDVMRVRRHQPTRLEGFVDASFAFALTLVVISFGHVPQSVTEMLDALRDVPTFAICFTLISRFWLSHRNWSRFYDIEDSVSTVLSLVLVFLVLIYVYPLRLLFTLAFSGWHTNEPVAGQNDFDYFDYRAAFVVFGLGFAAIWFVFLLLYRHALKLATKLNLAPAEMIVTRFRIFMDLGLCATALLSVTLAAVLPIERMPNTQGLPALVYLLIFPLLFVLKRRCMRRVAAISADAAFS